MIEAIHAISHSLRTRLLAAMLLVPLVALAMVTSGVGLRCRITGEVTRACCCERGDGPAAASERLATVSQSGCCDRVVREVTLAPAEVIAASALPDQTTPVARVAFAAPPADRARSVLSSRSDVSASIGPPTVRLRLVAKSTFLI